MNHPLQCHHLKQAIMMMLCTVAGEDWTMEHTSEFMTIREAQDQFHPPVEEVPDIVDHLHLQVHQSKSGLTTLEAQEEVLVFQDHHLLLIQKSPVTHLIIVTTVAT